MKLDPALDIISVHQMGKVGSTSVYHTLRAALPKFHLFHTHQFNAETILKVARQSMTKDGKLPPHLRDSIYFRDWVRQAEKAAKGPKRKREKAPRIHLISMLREPVARNISALFENIDLWIARLPEEDRKKIERWLSEQAGSGTGQQSDISDVLQRFQELFMDKYRHDLPQRWLNRELCKPFGFELMSKPFDKEKGYTIYEFPTCRLLFMTLESLNAVMVPALREFLGLPEIEAARANTGTDKHYAPLYKKFTSTIDLPADYLDRAYDNDMMRHFYTAQQIASFRARWSKEKKPA